MIVYSKNVENMFEKEELFEELENLLKLRRITLENIKINDIGSVETGGVNKPYLSILKTIRERIVAVSKNI